MSKPRGLGLTDKPATSNALTSYLRTRAVKAGYTQTVLFYALCRRSAYDLTKTYGAGTARHIMNHEPDALVRQVILTDNTYFPHSGTEKAIKNYKRRVRTAASKALLDQEVQKQRQDLSVVDMNRRYEDLQTSRTVQRLIQLASEYMSAPNPRPTEVDPPVEEAEPSSITHTC